MKAYGIAALVLALALPACASESTPEAQPTTQAPTPSPTPTLPPVESDKTRVKKAVVTSAELGKPWVTPKAVNTAKQKQKGDLCPGQPNARTLHPPRARGDLDHTEGTKPGAAIGAYGVRAYAFGEQQAWRDALAKAQAGCKSWTSLEKLYVELEVVTPPAIPGADEVVVHIERIYADKTKKTLHYVRHYYEAWTTRFVSEFELAYIQPKSDPTGKDLTKSSELFAKQVAKTRETFGIV
ncbi:MAG TPA: hypothetical protein VNQ77_15695 [Frankiaceae bacterium]|nr:hypothetical protein [Frankiaceae bacterium]